MPSINDGHPTLKSWCWAINSFLAVYLFVLHTVPSVSRQCRMLYIWKTLHSSQIYLLQSMSSASRQFHMLSTRKTLHNNQFCCSRVHLWADCSVCLAYGKNVQQSDFVAAVSVVCVHVETFTQQSDMIAAVNPVWDQTDPYAEQTETLFSVEILLLRSYLHFKYFLTFGLPFLLDNYVPRFSSAVWNSSLRSVII